MAENEVGEPVSQNNPPKPKSRPIVRIGIFLISHSTLVSVVCCIAGVLTIFLLPLLAKTTYVSENALMPGSANPMFHGHEATEASQLVKDIMSFKQKMGDLGREVPRLLAQRMEATGAETYHHKFHAETNKFYPPHFFSASPYTRKMQENSSCTSHGINTVGIIRATRGDGKEAIVLVTPYNSSKVELNEALSLGLAYSFFSLLSRVNWLAKDIIWLAADSRHGEYSSVDAWLKDYHTPVFSSLKDLDTESCLQINDLPEWKENPAAGRKMPNVFRRAGTMAAALVFKVVDRQEVSHKDTLTIYSEASNGQMPNLDLLNVVHYLAVHRQGLHVKVEKFNLLFNSAWLKIVGEALQLIGKVAQTLNPQWKFGISAADYVEGASTLASSVYHQALGIPTGSHGAFRDYQVDAITLEISAKGSLNSEARRSEFILRGGRLLEGIIRSVNNLLEKFHQSFFLYLLTSPDKFVSVGVYMIAFALLIIPLPVAAAALYSGLDKSDSSSTTNSHKADPTTTEAYGTALKNWRWLHAAKVVLVVHLWGLIISLVPFIIIQLPERTPASSMLAWVSLSFFSLVILYGILGSPYLNFRALHSQNKEWAILKAVMIAVASIGLGLMSIINFATAQIGACVLVPMCLFAHPLKHVGRTGRFRALTLTTVNLVLASISFPPAAFLLLKGCSEGFDSVGLGDFWSWAESLWAWNSATYLYLILIHLPCWLLCIHVLLHPC